MISEIQASRFDYEKNVDDFVEQLIEIYKNPKDKINHNIKNAIHFFRIGDNFAPKYQELFYYVAAMEHLLLGRHDRNVLRWKFACANKGDSLDEYIETNFTRNL